MSKLTTIGVYGFTGATFLETLQQADVRLLLDVRQRRGVRGPDYAWANSQRLQAALATVGILYEHHRELSPTTDLRHLQYAEDDRLGVGKRSRVELTPVYIDRYIDEILDRADMAPVGTALPDTGAAALFCVERDPEACHRSLIAQRLRETYDIQIVHLRPQES